VGCSLLPAPANVEQALRGRLLRRRRRDDSVQEEAQPVRPAPAQLQASQVVVIVTLVRLQVARQVKWRQALDRHHQRWQRPADTAIAIAERANGFKPRMRDRHAQRQRRRHRAVGVQPQEILEVSQACLQVRDRRRDQRRVLDPPCADPVLRAPPFAWSFSVTVIGARHQHTVQPQDQVERQVPRAARAPNGSQAMVQSADIAQCHFCILGKLFARAGRLVFERWVRSVRVPSIWLPSTASRRSRLL
jgi:hypothetical protein